MSIYETLMTSGFELENYKGSPEEKIALRTLATEMVPSTDFTFGEEENSKANFAEVFNFLLGLSPEALKEGNSLLVERLFKIKADAYMNYSNARSWYLSNKETFDAAYSAVLDYMRENKPDLFPKTR